MRRVHSGVRMAFPPGVSDFIVGWSADGAGRENRPVTRVIMPAVLTAAMLMATACGDGATEHQQPQPNRAPVAHGSIPAQTVPVGESVTVNVSSAFSDPDGDALTYAASSSAPAAVSVAVSGADVTVTGISAGTTRVTVTASDPDGLSAQQSFPVTVPGGVCERTTQVRNKIVHVTGAASCGAVTEADLAGIQSLDLSRDGLTVLQEGDFAGLSSLESLYLWGNDLTALREGVFAGLSSLELLYLYENDLTALPEGVFAGLSSLRWLFLGSNDLTTLPAGVFAGLSSLGRLSLSSNDLTALPEGVFAGLSSLEWLWLHDNPGSPFPLALGLERTDGADTASAPAKVRITLAEGAPFAMTIPLSVQGGTAWPGRTSLPAGSTEGQAFTVTQAASGQPARVAAASLPGIPEYFTGFTLSSPDTLVLFGTGQGDTSTGHSDIVNSTGSSTFHTPQYGVQENRLALYPMYNRPRRLVADASCHGSLPWCSSWERGSRRSVFPTWRCCGLRSSRLNTASWNETGSHGKTGRRAG